MAPKQDTDPLYLHPHASANEPVTLHEGPVTTTGGAMGTGTLILRWLPSAELQLEADLTGNTPDVGARVEADIGGNVAEVLVNGCSFREKNGVHFTRVTGSVSVFEKSTEGEVQEIGFQ